MDGSSREFRKTSKELTVNEAFKAFQDLEPVKYNYKR